MAPRNSLDGITAAIVRALTARSVSYKYILGLRTAALLDTCTVYEGLRDRMRTAVGPCVEQYCAQSCATVNFVRIFYFS